MKRFLFFLVLCVGCVVFVGCGGGLPDYEEDTNATPSPVPTKTETSYR